MLTAEQNDRLTRVGPGTPTGELMRRYWHPIAAVAMMNDRSTKPIRLLGEDLILYKSNQGVFGLVDNYCPHRRMGMVYGIPTDDGIRCAYHGWMFDETGDAWSSRTKRPRRRTTASRTRCASRRTRCM